ncbi:hypothetical protein Q4566_14820 [Tamlana sp. 2_MG-2023]|uniref:hypothetical protein n=1 Tax=unclassified Tamlana TaxID=2614803 RepID=UPI0026E2F754|nr:MULTISPECIES: hypothetical protein [unclassified Tamlana]MDO6761482.1 hypothetical protein [Tamlana sp. 2_MG-2023]MDO6792343.1 hypothetical protein [Tamlana sp. 1_MG-2023]
MMKQKLTLLCASLIAIVFYSCGPSIKVTDTWKAPDIREIHDDKILVIARMDDRASRQLFEQEIVSKLKSVGINAVPSYSTYPDIKINKKLEESEVNEDIAKFKKDGFGAVALTVVKDVKTEINTEQSGGYVAGGYYPGFYGGYGGFGGYYGSFYSPYGMGGSYIPSSQRTYESDIYKLETVVYDLGRENSKQLVAVVNSEITDPDSASGVAKPYAEKVLEQFNK